MCPGDGLRGRYTGRRAHQRRLQSPGAKGDPLTLDGGYLGGQVTAAPDKPGAPASWTQFAGLGLVTGGKYIAAGVKTGLH